ncbi:hypothetical protein MKW94_015613 [Papaver nudicaule]|uniref:Protein DCL, chloroplastic n=1 Tax=Papaver nudicaule TaxID=74823 RepID=A0AA41W0V3_PAPNU|nr:hypothetical protein [Papaver nudicaule]
MAVAASIINSPPPSLLFSKNSNPNSSSPSVLYFPIYKTTLYPLLRTSSSSSNSGSRISCQDSNGPDLLRKPAVVPIEEQDELRNKKKKKSSSEEEEVEGQWDDWEDQILEDTVPLVGFVRMLLHSGKYESEERLIPEHEKTIRDRLLPYHPEYEKKIGPGIDYIKIGYHPDFESSRCMFIVRKDGESVDFSYWKCIKGLIRKNYPQYADGFILRHFRQRKRNE